MHRRILPTIALAFAASVVAFTAQAADIKNIVIVHGDFSGWRQASDILQRRGFNVTVVQEPLTSLAADIEATNRVLDLQDGPTLLVGHSYGGLVITEAGHHRSVEGLVYVAAFQPDKGENIATLAGSKPPAAMSIKETADGKYLYLDPEAFAADFAADLPAAEVAFAAKAQVFAAKEVFATRVNEPAWRTKKSWAIIATEDRAINPDLGRSMAKRAGSQVTEIKASHAVFASQAEKVADVIETAAKGAGK
ncbi:MAG TPA: alpha/beta hydrolase [Ensifer sp.]|jgi:pimeloyl-ACP methyl ester carboxylesterase|uniref:alpha/beta hydrolase n=1 Tax=Ensifer sp. TaxID=1872086 RepID=UPI002E102303|nr:alpha/beta hydrolase [Ensifer sp.]